MEVTIGDDGMLKLQVQICVPNMDGLWELILVEARSLWYSINLGTAKVYHNLKLQNWWRIMKRDIVEYAAKFTYNNNYELSLHMAPYEALYGRQCHFSIGWFEHGEARLLGTDLVHYFSAEDEIDSRSASYTVVQIEDLCE
ncbi:uncharacterized protein [Nicotiana sylvestris]|uniref:Uncharacterized protein LOC104248058 n=1 Tax=Nicotiana sylvestris TaxID=4096 RepID=A0A1U7YUU5_NICSY|nr:PREDICTED: uncharacterized protein LOC104248058 [Nicotiana sylvestris]